jgi:hypothetical protein
VKEAGVQARQSLFGVLAHDRRIAQYGLERFAESNG